MPCRARPCLSPAEEPGTARLAARRCQGTDNEAGEPGLASQPVAAATPHAPVRAQASAERPVGYSTFGGRKNTAIHPVTQPGKTLLAAKATNT